MHTPEFDIGEWKEFKDANWEKQPFLFASDISALAVSNQYIECHVNKIDMPFRLIDSYRSYLIQAIKDTDHLVSSIISGEDQIQNQITYSIDSALTRAQPWRFTGYLLKFINSQIYTSHLRDLDASHIWPLVDTLLQEAFENGSLFRIEKYIKVAHVLLDISFDIGWDTVHKKASLLKQVEGLINNPERAATLREVSLFIGRNFWYRGFMEAAEQIIYIGFPDIPEVVGSLKREELENLLTKMNSREAVQTLFNAQMEKSSKSTSCSQIVEGALRIIEGRSAM